MQKFIAGLAIFRLCGFALSYRDFPFNDYQSCDKGNWQCAVGRQCSTCTITDNNQETVVHKCDPDNNYDEALCPNSEPHLGGGWSCQCNGPAWDGLDASTGLITGVNMGNRNNAECHKDVDCTDPNNPSLHRRCATCKFEAFGGDFGYFCVNPEESNVQRKYCDKNVNHGKCWCSDLKSAEETGFEQASIGTAVEADGEPSFNPASIVQPVADFGAAFLNPIGINKQAAIDPLFGNLEAAAPNDELNGPVQTGFDQNGLSNDFKLSSNSFLGNQNNNDFSSSDLFLNPASGRKKRARSN